MLRLWRRAEQEAGGKVWRVGVRAKEKEREKEREEEREGKAGRRKRHK